MTVSMKQSIQELILVESSINQEIKDDNIDFGFQIQFPRDPNIAKPYILVKPKNSNSLEIRCQVNLPDLEKLEQDKKIRFFNSIKRAFLLKGVLYSTDIPNNRYIVIEKLYLDKEPTLNSFYEKLRKLLDCITFSIVVAQELSSNGASPTNASSYII